jgi:hypothetical protein
MSVEWNSISLAKAYLKYPKKRRVYSSLQVDYSFLFWSLFSHAFAVRIRTENRIN